MFTENRNNESYKKPFYANNNGGNNHQNKSWGNKSFKPKQEEDLTNFKLYKPYVGTGNMGAPQNVLDSMSRLARELNTFGYTVRTGGTQGPEEVFEQNGPDQELHLPFNNYNNKQSQFAFISKKAYIIAKQFHPTYDMLSEKVHIFLAKNARLVLGKDLKSPALFVVCWTEDGCEHVSTKTSKTGNTGHLIAIASALHIPIFNLAKPDAEVRLKKHLGINNVKEEPNQIF